jgi:hypothetical protein
MGMSFTFSNLFQLISSMSSFLLVFFMVMISFFNSDAKGLIYLGFLMIASILNVLLMNSKKSEPCAERSQFCNVMEFPWNPHNYNSPDYNSMVIMFTAAYLLLPMIYNKQMNYGAIMFMLILFAFNYITQIMFLCCKGFDMVFGGLIGLVMGATFAGILKMSGGEKFLYFNELSSNNTVCERPSKQTFKCSVYKNGKIIQNL